MSWSGQRAEMGSEVGQVVPKSLHIEDSQRIKEGKVSELIGYCGIFKVNKGF